MYRSDQLQIEGTPRVLPAPASVGADMFYISCVATVKDELSRNFYLHADGLWHVTAAGVGESSGYFMSESAARLVLNAHYDCDFSSSFEEAESADIVENQATMVRQEKKAWQQEPLR